jgi:beta-galactosidase
MLSPATKRVLLAGTLLASSLLSFSQADAAAPAPAAPAGAAARPAPAPASARAQFNFNPGWKLFVGDPANAQDPTFDDGEWKAVTLPHAWNEDSAFKVSIVNLPTGIAWYRKHFKLPPAAAGKKVFLEFQGMRFAGEFWLNGKPLGLHENSIMAVGFDVTDALRPGGEENVIAVRVDNSWTYRERATDSTFQWNDRNFYANYGGINKNVVLHLAEPLYQTLPLYSNLGTTGVYIYGTDYDVPGKAATVHAESQVRNDSPTPQTFTYEVRITDPTGALVRTIPAAAPTTLAPGQTTTVSAAARVTGLNFWSWGYGYLYDVQTVLSANGRVVDAVTTRTGFRKTEFANGAVKLNDRTLHLKGYAQRTTNEWPALGVNVPPWVSDYSNSLFVQSNGNLVRWMHVTPSKQDVESCDRVGLIQAMPAGDSEGDPTGRRWDLRTEVMRDAIIYNRNNPSIVFYETGNKGVTEDHMSQMKALRDQYDPHGGRAAGSREMLNSKVAEYGGEMLYINKSSTIPLWMMEYSRDEALRKWWDDFSPPFHKNGTGPGNAPDYNRNQDSQAVENVIRWYEYWAQRPGTGARVNAGGVKIIWSDSNTHHRGSENFRRSGTVDAMRLPKDAFYVHQVMWDGWVNTDKPAAYIVGHWNYAAGTQKPVYVVSSADKVELFLNGKSLGAGAQSNRFLFTFDNVAWQPGELRAVGYDAAGKQLCETSKKTAGDPAALRLTRMTNPAGMRADGSDLALVDVEVVDAQGNRCPTALDMVDFALSGPAEWRGGLAQGPDNYILAKSLPVECGINRVSVRSTTTPGTITLTATSGTLKPASLSFETRAVAVQDGISPVMPADGLTARLDRGPTPAGESFVMSRTPVKIASATAGANAAQAGNSFDDNETTNWSAGPDLANAWIQYTLERSADVSEITLKMGDFRNRSYPIQITVDGKPAYKGDTPRTLGYVNLSFKPVTGKTVRISVTGSGIDADAFNNLVEVTGNKLPDTAQPSPAPATGPAAGRGGPGAPNRAALAIVEAEVYEPVKK